MSRCHKCKQLDIGQVGELKCPACGLPQLWYASSATQVYDRLVEELAALEHEQWMCWSKSVAIAEAVPKEVREQWSAFWRPYHRLEPESLKELDRHWARRVLDILKKYNVDSLLEHKE
jgi:hypothetical protein